MPNFSYLNSMVRPKGIKFSPGTLTFEKARLWIKPVLFYTSAAFVMFVFMTEWRVIMGHVPIYKNKWKDE